jgi:DNA-binding transcriptional ArsR family regulator
MRRDVFQAIADPTRREIINRIARQTMNLNSVSENFSISRPAISRHIKKQGRERYCEANLKSLNQVSEWIDQYRVFWTRQLDALGTFLHAATPAGNDPQTSRKSPAANKTLLAEKPPAANKRKSSNKPKRK